MTNKIPRNFVLLSELENVGKYTTVSYGTEDNELETFTGSIFAQNNYIYAVNIFCDKQYPVTPPSIHFIDAPDVLPSICNSDGTIKQSILDKITWGETNCKTIGEMLTCLEKYIK